MAFVFSAPRWIPLTLLVITTTPSLAFAIPPAIAIQYRDGTVEFTAQPRLVDSHTTRNLASDSGATYYLTVDFPAAAEEAMDRIVIRLDEGWDPLFRYRLEATEAWQTVGEERRAVSLGTVTEDRDTQTLTLSFDPPLPPGGIITLALRPVRNPRFAGVYLFGVTAFPVGETVQPRFMGFARLSFYERDRRPWP
ncbi:MAG: DUF2808 domain-containing protein [Leptolyngbya sp.]|nr:DUF2808 domain-containing protein [Leptolyngbya sp.]